MVQRNAWEVMRVDAIGSLEDKMELGNTNVTMEEYMVLQDLIESYTKFLAIVREDASGFWSKATNSRVNKNRGEYMHFNSLIRRDYITSS